MKIKTKQQLIDFLADQSQYRKRELIAFAQEIKTNDSKPNPRVARSAVVMAYAHWEGFIKAAATAYVELAAYKTRKLSELAPPFQALACRQQLATGQTATRRIAPHIELVRRFTDHLNQSCTIDASTAIDTESNLRSGVLENLCASVGIDYHKEWSTYGPFIDELFSQRCLVAHGELFAPENKYAQEAINFCISAIDKFSTSIENAAVLEAYLRTPKA